MSGIQLLKLIEASESVIMAQLQMWRIVMDWNRRGALVLDEWTVISTISSVASVGYAASTFRFVLATDHQDEIKSRAVFVVASFIAGGLWHGAAVTDIIKGSYL